MINQKASSANDFTNRMMVISFVDDGNHNENICAIAFPLETFYLADDSRGDAVLF